MNRKSFLPWFFDIQLMILLLSVKQYPNDLERNPIYITFDHNFAGIQLPFNIRSKDDESSEITIALQYSYYQNHFKNLNVNLTGFDVFLYVNDGFKRLVIPFAAVNSYDVLGIISASRKSEQNYKINKGVFDCLYHMVYNMVTTKFELSSKEQSCTEFQVLNFEDIKKK